MVDQVYTPQNPIVSAEIFEEEVYKSLSSGSFCEKTKLRAAAIIAGAQEEEESDEVLDAITWYHATKIGSFYTNGN